MCRGPFDQLLDVHLGAAEGALRLARRVAKRRFEVGLAVHAPHALCRRRPPPPSAGPDSRAPRRSRGASSSVTP